MLQLITFRRFINAFRLVAGYLLSGAAGKPFHFGAPMAFSAEPTTSCNLRCPECPTGQRELKRPGGTMDLSFFRQVIEQLSNNACYLTLYFQGEPYMNRQFFEMVRVAKSKKLFVSTSTNGQFLDRDTALETVQCKLDRLMVSLDGASQESYAAYRQGGRFDKVIEGLGFLAEAKETLHRKKPQTVIQCLLLRTNQHEKEQIRRIGKEVHADSIEFKTAQFYDFENGNPLMPEGKDSRYRVSDPPGHPVTRSPRYVVKNKLRNHCFRMWSSCVITWDGLVVPCCFDKDATHVMGDLKKNTFEEIWKGETYRTFRSMILKNRKGIDICRNCTAP